MSGDPGNRQIYTEAVAQPPRVLKGKIPRPSGVSRIDERGHASDAFSPKLPSRGIERRKYQRHRQAVVIHSAPLHYQPGITRRRIENDNEIMGVRWLLVVHRLVQQV